MAQHRARGSEWLNIERVWWLNIERVCWLNIEHGVIERVKPLPLKVAPAPGVYCEEWTGSEVLVIDFGNGGMVGKEVTSQPLLRSKKQKATTKQFELSKLL